jgi:hypothetical protein
MTSETLWHLFRLFAVIFGHTARLAWLIRHRRVVRRALTTLFLDAICSSFSNNTPRQAGPFVATTAVELCSRPIALIKGQTFFNLQGIGRPWRWVMVF